jgi:hypothetical protein
MMMQSLVSYFDEDDVVAADDGNDAFVLIV